MSRRTLAAGLTALALLGIAGGLETALAGRRTYTKETTLSRDSADGKRLIAAMNALARKSKGRRGAGTNDRAAITQYGSGNAAGIVQRGGGNTGSITQNSNRSASYLIQLDGGQSGHVVENRDGTVTLRIQHRGRKGVN